MDESTLLASDSQILVVTKSLDIIALVGWNFQFLCWAQFGVSLAFIFYRDGANECTVMAAMDASFGILELNSYQCNKQGTRSRPFSEAWYVLTEILYNCNRLGTDAT